MSTSNIYHFRRIDANTACAGQPNEEQLRAAAQDGFEAVVNLALDTSPKALPDEAGLARSLGMTYFHIPVEWENPTQADFEAFVQAMQGLAGRRVLVHCAANYRATAFYGLYGRKCLGWSQAEADALRAGIWQVSDYPVWEAFIRRVGEEINRDKKDG